MLLSRLFRLDERSLPHLLTAGMLCLVVAMAGTIGILSILHDSRELETRLASQEEETLAAHEAHLRDELAALANYLEFQRASREEKAKTALREHVDQVIDMIEHLYEREKDRLPPERLRTLIVEALRPMRFLHGRGYYFIDDLHGNCVLLPTNPEREGSPLWNNRDDTGHYIMRGLLDATKNPEGRGYSRYRWYRPDHPNEMADKLAYVRRFEPLGWVIGAGEYLHEVEADLQREALARIAALRFHPDGVVGVLTLDGEVLLEPRLPTEKSGLRPAALGPAADWTKQALDTARHGGGKLELVQSTAHGSQHRLAYVSQHEPWGWYLVASIGLNELDDILDRERIALQQSAHQRLRLALIALGLCTATTLLLGVLLSRWLSGRFAMYHNELALSSAALRESNRQLQLSSRVFESGNEAMMVLDEHFRFLSVNPAFLRLIGNQPELAGPGTCAADLISVGDQGLAPVQHALAQAGAWNGEATLRLGMQSMLPVQLSINAVANEEGQVAHYVGALADISARKEAEARLRRLAEFDPLTELPNRALLRQRMDEAIEAARQDGTPAALLFIDLDRFKNVNDSLGHGVGDALLQQVAARLRTLAGDGDTVGRSGGDEFILVLRHTGAATEIASHAERIVRQFAAPFLIGRYELSVTPSIGIAVWPQDGEDAETLLRNADAAMYHAKSAGRNTYKFFTAEMNLQVRERLELENLLRQAEARNELSVHYQPQVELAGGRLIGCEALLRWHAGERGNIPPDRFIPVAEDTGLIVPIGRWILKTACAQAQAWRQAGLGDLQVAVNASAVQLHHGDFVETVATVLAETGLPPDLLEIELTESTLMTDADSAAATLRALKVLGVGLAIDDFGTGYSSLAYLKRFQLDRLKIDRSFINDLPADKDDANITRTIVGIARNLGLSVLAEGVETPAQHQFLLEHGCDEGQGYLFSRPLPAGSMEALLRATGTRGGA
ncbi:EAL domain-containing protein [Azoarcus indigens]|uniref:PAS domain S-box-containing protein/diguanylate cyclase (GGDEF)-like protein n=1 Tax=Azoarcus indigens TaxID=29545 RepID=A0A4R6DXL4_9RHOO|nr:EAL domain-containing protein [Azoarcus indigens]NMG65677.1 EAL domain-containing protein [Azoarcus indigens]TDN50056.1 PAS domain S-box-containing protein/diguanylate cyclase (GGDEF)-like protein [Azoarcus indigens]